MVPHPIYQGDRYWILLFGADERLIATAICRVKYEWWCRKVGIDIIVSLEGWTKPLATIEYNWVCPRFYIASDSNFFLLDIPKGVYFDFGNDRFVCFLNILLLFYHNHELFKFSASNVNSFFTKQSFLDKKNVIEILLFTFIVSYKLVFFWFSNMLTISFYKSCNYY